jgi:LysR family transcriptional regulator, regulator for metE and metH
MMIEIRHLMLIREIASTGNMTRAAQKLFLTQPSLSHQLKEIESRLGVQLFLRVNKTLVLTAEGTMVLQAALEILPRIESLEKGIGQGNGKANQLRISTHCYTCYHWLPPLMQKFSLKNARIEFDVVTEAMNNPVEFILKNEIDIAIMNSKTEDNGVHFEKLFDDEQVLIVTNDHPLAGKEFVRPKDFENENLIIYKESFDADYFVTHILMPAGVTPKRVTKMQLTEARVELVKAGLGVTVLSRWLVSHFVHKNSNLKFIRITKKGFYRTWFLASLKQKRNDDHIRQFITFLKEQQFGSR